MQVTVFLKKAFELDFLKQKLSVFHKISNLHLDNDVVLRQW